MNLEFKIYQLKEDSRTYKQLVQTLKLPNEFIIVGEKMVGKKLDCFKVQPIEEKGISIIGGMKIDEVAFDVPKGDLELKGDGIGIETYEFDIPKKYLTMNIIENIQRLNA